jgi:hypothetical protein
MPFSSLKLSSNIKKALAKGPDVCVIPIYPSFLISCVVSKSYSPKG